MEDLEIIKKNKINKNFWKKKKILVTGCEGFMSSWLIVFLKYLGANIYGFDKQIPDNKIFFNNLKLKKKINYKTLNILNQKKIFKFVKKVNPDITFHFAAQSLVLEGYLNPLKTIETNINGSINILESLSKLKKKNILIISTTDKVYMSKKKIFSENDQLGGKDPYSASKACIEILVKYYQLFKKNLFVSTVRAGNIIGHGDWAENRLLPDIFRKKKINIRNKNHIRPWQHVLEPIYGYILLSQKMSLNKKYCTSYNFGPDKSNQISVIELVKKIKKYYNFNFSLTTSKKKLEDKYLFLNNAKAKKLIKLKPRWNINQTLKNTVEGYTSNLSGKFLYQYTLKIIKNFLKK